MKYHHIFFLIFSGLLFSCSKKVLVSVTDNLPPETTLNIIQDGRVNSVTSKEATTEPIEVLAGNEIVFIAIGSDTMGIKSLNVKVIENGSFKINDQLVSTYENNASEIDTLGMGDDRIYITGYLYPDTPNREMIISAESEDHANNKSKTPAMRIKFIKEAEVRLSTNKSIINRGENVTLTYETENVDAVYINDAIQNTYNGSITVSPLQTTTYTLKGENSLSSDEASTTIEVTQPQNNPRINTFNASPSSITKGQSTTLSWSTQNASSINIAPINYNSSSASSGSKTVNPTSTTTYTMTATGPGGSITKTVKVIVNPPIDEIICVTTPQSILSFTYWKQMPNGTHFYNMELSPFAAYNPTSITKITNKSGVQLALWTDGQSVILNPNQSTTVFNGYSIARGWSVQTKINDAILSPRIEFCYEKY